MKVLELFAGTESIGRAFSARGHEVFSIDWDTSFAGIDWYIDINRVTVQDMMERFGRPDVIWASPNRTTFSVAAISHHRRKDPMTGYLYPVSAYARYCDEVDQHVLGLIQGLCPALWFIEDPRGSMRKMPWMQGLLLGERKPLVLDGSVLNFVFLVFHFIPEAGCGQSPQSLVNTGYSNL